MSGEQHRTVTEILARLVQEEPGNSVVAAIAARPLALPVDDEDVPTEQFLRVPGYVKQAQQRQ